MWLTWLSLLLFLSVGSTQHEINQCALRCKDNHMKEMSNEWSEEFIMPVLKILRKTGNETAAFLKLETICNGNTDFDRCLANCNNSQEVAIMRTGIADSMAICENLANLRNQLSCWKAYSEQLLRECQDYTAQLISSANTFARNASLSNMLNVCQHFNYHAACNVEIFHRICGYASWEIIQRLFTNSKEVMYRMLEMKFMNQPLPVECHPSSVQMYLNGASSLSLFMLPILFIW